MENSELSDACSGPEPSEAALLQSQYKGGISTYSQLGLFKIPSPMPPFFKHECLIDCLKIHGCLTVSHVTAQQTKITAAMTRCTRHRRLLFTTKISCYPTSQVSARVLA